MCNGAGIRLNELFGMIEQTTYRMSRRSYDATRTMDILRVEMQAGCTRVLYDPEPKAGLKKGPSRTWKWFCTTQR